MEKPIPMTAGMRSTGRMLAACLLLLLVSSPHAFPADKEVRRIRVALFPLEPLNYVAADGTARGLNPDLLNEIARINQWQIEYVPGSWGTSMERLQSEQIDMMTTIAHTPERARTICYSTEPVVDIWGQVYILPGTEINTIRDLHYRRVGIMRKDINGQNFIKTAARFSVTSIIVEYDTHQDIFTAVAGGTVDAGVAPQHFGFRHARDYGLVGSSIQFEPFSVYYGTKKGRNEDLLKTIDRQLHAWKHERDSYYHRQVAYWMGGKEFEREIIPRWLLVLLGTGVIVSVALILINRYLNYLVRQRTRALIESESFRQRIFESSRVPIVILDAASLQYIDCNPAAAVIYGVSTRQELLAKGPLDFSAPVQYDGTAAKVKAGEYIARAIEQGMVVFEWKHLRPDGSTWDGEVHLMAFLSDGRQLLQFTLQDITERKRIDRQLRASLREKETLLRELYHRTKNNMQVICSILSLEANREGREDLQPLFTEIELKIRTMAIVHQKLYESGDLSNIELREYIQEISRLVIDAGLVLGSAVTVDVAGGPLAVSIDVALPLGLVLNELITNSVKHAFPPGTPGSITIAIERIGEQIVIRYRDSGAGLPPGFRLGANASLGMLVIGEIVRHQLRGRMELLDDCPGFSCTMSVAADLYAKRI